MARIFPALAALLLGGALATAQGPNGFFGQHRPPFQRALGNQGHWWNNPHMIETLKLSDDQRKAMDQILFQHREKLIDLQANLQRAELAMEPLMSADQPDRAAITAQINKVVNARAELERANSLFLLDIRMKLTPDQWKQLKDERGNRMERHREIIERHGQRGDGGRMWHQRSNGSGAPPPPEEGNPGAGQPQSAQPDQPQPPQPPQQQ